jgi:hypothetical protein
MLKRQVDDAASSSAIQAAPAPSSIPSNTPASTIAPLSSMSYTTRPVSADTFVLPLPTSTTAPLPSTTDSTWDDWTLDGSWVNTDTPSASAPSQGAMSVDWIKTDTTYATHTSATTTRTATAPIDSYIDPSTTKSDTLSAMMADDIATSAPLFTSIPHTHILNPSTATRTPLSGPSDVRTAPIASPSGSTGLRASNEGSLTSAYSVIITTQSVVGSNGQVLTFVVTMTSSFSSSTTLAQPSLIDPSPKATIAPDSQQTDEVDLGLTTTGLQYFRAMYLPTVVAVLLKLVWSIVFASTKLMEPFYLLSREGGASAKDSLVADYLTSTLSIDGIRNLFAGHAVVILASLAYICISVLPALATQSTTIRAVGVCYSTTGQSHCEPRWQLNITYARVLQGILLVTVLLILGMMILSARRQSGVFSNPSSIATMASLLSNDEFISEIRKIPQSSCRSTIRRFLDPIKFKLARYATVSGHVRYGFVRTADPPPRPALEMCDQHQCPARSNNSGHEHPLSKERSPISNCFLIDVIFLLAIIALLSITVAYYLTSGDNGFNNFFNHHPLRTFVLTLTASILDGRWKQLEHEVRLMTPYRRLFRGSAEPETTILVTQNATAITSFFSALWHGNIFHAFVAVVATLSDVLIIVIGSVPHSPAQFKIDFVVCVYTSWVILGIMAVMMLALFRWRALNEKMMMPHEPNTLFAVCQSLCNERNGLCEETTEHETMQSAARNERIKLNNSRYWAGWITEPDSSQRWVVEKEKPSKTVTGRV